MIDKIEMMYHKFKSESQQYLRQSKFKFISNSESYDHELDIGLTKNIL